MIKKIQRSLLQRLQLLFGHNFLNLSERIYITTRIRPVSLGGTKKVFLKRLASQSEENYFKINGDKIYFEPDYKIGDREYFLKGITQVLAETYLFPRLFSKEVYLRPGDVCLDVGANIGTVSLLFSRLVGDQGRVIAIEPIVSDITTKNKNSNNRENITVVPVALSNQSGEVEMLISDYCLDSTLLGRNINESGHGIEHYELRRKVKTVMLDNLVADLNLSRVDFIKIDIEGAEELALLGAHNTLSKWKPKLSISSYHIDHVNEKQHKKLVKLLKTYNYTIKEEDNSHIFAW